MPSRVKVTKRPPKISVSRKSVPKSGVREEDPRWVNQEQRQQELWEEDVKSRETEDH